MHWKTQMFLPVKKEEYSFFPEEFPGRHHRSILSLGKTGKMGPQWQHHEAGTGETRIFVL